MPDLFMVRGTTINLINRFTLKVPLASQNTRHTRTHPRWLLVWLGCVASASLLPSGLRASARLQGGTLRNCHPPSVFTSTASCLLIGVAR